MPRTEDGGLSGERALRGHVAESVVTYLVWQPEINIPPPEVVMLFQEAQILWDWLKVLMRPVHR